MENMTASLHSDLCGRKLIDPKTLLQVHLEFVSSIVSFI